MMSRLGCTLLLVIATAASTFAQNRTNLQWWNNPIRKDLGLSAAQDEKIRQIVRSYRNRLLDARNEVQKAEGDLEDLFNDADVNSQAAQPVIERIATARANVNRVVLEMSVQLRSVLTSDQWRDLVRRWDEMQRKKPPDTQVPPE